jgi:hypothetical protein
MWDSRTLHQGIESRKGRSEENIRCVVYVCYLPRSTSDCKEIEKKKKAFNEGRMTTHWPNTIQLFPKQPRTYGNPIPNVTIPDKPRLTELGKKLAGF